MPFPPINPNNDSLNHYQVESGRIERENDEVINKADALVSIDDQLTAANTELDNITSELVDVNTELDTQTIILNKIYERVDTVTGASLANIHFPVTTQGVEVKVGSTPLSGRHSLVIGNDSSTIVSIANGVNAQFDDAFKLFSGQSVQITLDPSVPTTWYLRSRYFDTEVILIEAKGATD